MRTTLTMIITLLVTATSSLVAPAHGMQDLAPDVGAQELDCDGPDWTDAPFCGGPSDQGLAVTSPRSTQAPPATPASLPPSASCPEGTAPGAAGSFDMRDRRFKVGDGQTFSGVLSDPSAPAAILTVSNDNDPSPSIHQTFATLGGLVVNGGTSIEVYRVDVSFLLEGEFSNGDLTLTSGEDGRKSSIHGIVEPCVPVEPAPEPDCTLNQRRGGESVVDYLDRTGLDCVDAEVTEECGLLDGAVTRNDTSFDFDLRYVVGTDIPSDEGLWQTLPYEPAEDAEDGAVDVTVFIVGPEQDFVLEEDLAFVNEGVTFTVDTDCEDPTPVPDIEVAKTNDADRDGTYTDLEFAPGEGSDVAFRTEVTNTGQEAGQVRLYDTLDDGTELFLFGFDLERATDVDTTCVDAGGAPFGPTDVLDRGETITCDFELAAYSPDATTDRVNDVTAELVSYELDGDEPTAVEVLASSEDDTIVSSNEVAGETEDPDPTEDTDEPTEDTDEPTTVDGDDAAAPQGALPRTGADTQSVALGALALLALGAGLRRRRTA